MCSGSLRGVNYDKDFIRAIKIYESKDFNCVLIV